jgi:3-deoxy-D-manno-octulosonate 8-phosphate phosphatase (KDO 8-P phosphatase)
MNAAFKKKIKNIKLLILDVDGVLTNGEIILDSQGNEIKIFNVHDGFGIVLFQRAGLKTAILSVRSAGAVTARAKDLNITKVCQDAAPKFGVDQQILRELNLEDSQVCFIGDDLPDLEVLKKVGVAVTVPEASSEVKKVAHYVTKRQGGCGAVREVIELILKTQGQWTKILKTYGV